MADTMADTNKAEKGDEPMPQADEAADEEMSQAKAATTHTVPWVEKYRPQSLDDIFSHKDIVATLERFMADGMVPHMLFYGPPGTGKTSTILACARKMFGASYQSMILELNASDERGIDVVREKIKEFASTRKMFSSGFKLIVLDEADAMTKPAQFALRRVIEKYTQNTRFCIICNYVGKIIPALQSRCTRFRFAPLEESRVTERVAEIALGESLDMQDDGLKAVVKICRGDMRKALNILQATHMSSSLIDEAAVYSTTGQPLPRDIQAILHWLLNSPFTEAMQKLDELKIEKGLALIDIVREIHAYFMAVSFPSDLKCKVAIDLADLEYRLAMGASEKLQLGSLVGSFCLAKEKAVARASA